MTKYAPADCDLCPALVAIRTQIVEGRGTGGYVAFVGMAPGEDEDEKGKAFIGPSGRLLALLSQAAGLAVGDLYLTNAVRCHPAVNRRPKVGEIRACRPYLIKELEAVKPLVIVTLGDVALQSALGRAVTLGSVLGQTLKQPETGIPLIPTYHPAYLLRGQWQVADLVTGHIEKAREIADGERAEPHMGEYETADTIEKLRILRDYLLHPDTTEIAFDTETTGLEWREDELLCISFATQPGEGFVVPILSHRNVPRPEKPKGRKTRPPWPVDAHWDEDDWPEVLEILREIFTSGVKKVGQNAIFDVQFLERSPDVPYVAAATAFGFEIKGQIEDTMLLHHAIAEAAMPAEARKTKRHSLTVLAAQYSDLPYYEEEITIASSNKRRMADVPDEMLWQYSAADADAVERVAIPLRAKAEAEGTLWASEHIIQPLIRCCWEMEKRGVLVDVEYFDRLCKHYRDRIEALEAELWAIELPETKAPWKYLHAGALQRVLFQELKLPPSGIKTDSSHGCEACGAGLCFEHDGTDKDALAIIEAQTDHPIIPILRELRKLRKALSTSLDGGKGGFRRHIGHDGRVRSQYRPGGAETSRLSSSDPDMQNVPQRVEIEELDTKNAFHQIFTAPEGCGLMEADWSQLEQWVMAYTLAEEIGENGFLEILQSGRDIHTWAARGIARRMQGGLDEDLSDLEWKTEHPELRRQAKPFTFGANYGLTPEGLVQKGVADTVEEAAELMDAYFDTVPGLRAYHHYIRRCVVEDGYLDNKFRQRRHFPSAALLKACRRMHDLEALVREGYAYPIQSGGSTLHSAAHHLTEFAPVLIKRACRPVISVHDSLVLEFHWPSDKYAETTARIIKDLWEQTAAVLPLADGSRLGWQIPVDVQWGRSWGTMDHSLSAKGDLREE